MCLGLSILKPLHLYIYIAIWHPRVPTLDLHVENDDSKEGPVITVLGLYANMKNQ